ncbi:MAG: hypothetical protein K0S71_2032 [Clostridia bacterium]|jgi:uncharacterized membrane protein (DUF373 family)|nr:hypothetical protein [Clostridia bacterium]
MIKYIKTKIVEASDLLEMIISGTIAIAVVILIITLLKQIGILVLEDNTAESFRYFLELALNLVIGIEFIKMLCKHTPSTVIDVLLFTIARELIVGHTTPLDNLMSILSIAALFAIRKYLLLGVDDADKSSYRANQKARRINILSHVNIPHEKEETLEDVISKRLQEKNEKPDVGVCIYFTGVALRIAAVKEGRIERVEVIRYVHPPVEL